MIRIISQPLQTDLQAAYLPIPYTVTQDGISGLLPPAIDVTPMSDGNSLGVFPAGISSGSSGNYLYQLDMSGSAAAAISKLAGVPSPISGVVRDLPECLVKMSIRVDEYAPDSQGLLALTGETATSNEVYVIDAYRRANDADPGITTYSNFSSPRFLTRRSRTAVLPISHRDTISVFNPSPSGLGAGTGATNLRATFVFYDSASTEISSGQLELPYPSGSLIQFPIGPADIPDLAIPGAPGSLDGVSRYTVQIGREDNGAVSGDPGFLGDSIEVNISRAPCKYTTVYYYNSFGAWEQALFEESTTRRFDLSGSNYSRFGSTVTAQRSSRESIQITSSTRTAAEADALLDLANAQLIYLLVNNRPIPVFFSGNILPVAYGPGSNGAQPFQFTLRATAQSESQRPY